MTYWDFLNTFLIEDDSLIIGVYWSKEHFTPHLLESNAKLGIPRYAKSVSAAMLTQSK